MRIFQPFDIYYGNLYLSPIHEVEKEFGTGAP